MAAGAIGDQIGRKRCFVAGLWTFIVTSLLIGLSPNLLLLNLLRAVEGLGGALVLTSATSLLAQEFEGAQRTRAFSFLGTAFGVGLAFGPMASGFLIERLGWRALYFAIALIAVLILLLGTRRIRESRDPAAQGIDWPGTLLFTAALVALTFGIVRGPQDGWTSPRVLSLLVGTAVLLAAFVAVESRRPRPMLELSLFRYPRFIGVQLLPVATGFSFIALIVYLPIWFIVIQGRDAFTAGLAILPLTAPMLVVPLLAGRIAQHVSPGLLSGIGFLISALGSWALMRLSPDGGLWSMAIPMLLIGIGNGLPWGLMDALSVSVVPRSARAWRQASSPPCAWRGSHRHCRHRRGADRPDRAEAGGGGPGRRACAAARRHGHRQPDRSRRRTRLACRWRDHASHGGRIRASRVYRRVPGHLWRIGGAFDPDGRGVHRDAATADDGSGAGGRRALSQPGRARRSCRARDSARVAGSDLS